MGQARNSLLCGASERGQGSRLDPMRTPIVRVSAQCSVLSVWVVTIGNNFGNFFRIRGALVLLDSEHDAVGGLVRPADGGALATTNHGE